MTHIRLLKSALLDGVCDCGGVTLRTLMLLVVSTTFIHLHACVRVRDRVCACVNCRWWLCRARARSPFILRGILATNL